MSLCPLAMCELCLCSCSISTWFVAVGFTTLKLWSEEPVCLLHAITGTATTALQTPKKTFRCLENAGPICIWFLNRSCKRDLFLTVSRPTLLRSNNVHWLGNRQCTVPSGRAIMSRTDNLDFPGHGFNRKNYFMLPRKHIHGSTHLVKTGSCDWMTCTLMMTSSKVLMMRITSLRSVCRTT